MPVVATIEVFEAELPLPAQAAFGVAAQPHPHLVHALVQPLHARVFAGAPAMLGGAFGGSAAAEPEGRSGDAKREDDHGKAHTHSVGLVCGWLKVCAGSFYSRAGPLR